jgi:hypothetical protein
VAKELSPDEFYFIDFVPAGFSYDQYRVMGNCCPVFMNNFAHAFWTSKPNLTRLDFIRALGKAGGFFIGWGKRRTPMKIQTIVDCNAYQVQGIGFRDKQDATAFILAWS